MTSIRPKAKITFSSRETVWLHESEDSPAANSSGGRSTSSIRDRLVSGVRRWAPSVGGDGDGGGGGGNKRSVRASSQLQSLRAPLLTRQRQMPEREVELEERLPVTIIGVGAAE